MSDDRDLLRQRLARKASWEEGRLEAMHQCRLSVERALELKDASPEVVLQVLSRIITETTRSYEREHLEAVDRYVKACQPDVPRSEAIKSPGLKIIAGRVAPNRKGTGK